MCTGCSPDYSWEAENEREMELDELKAEMYNQAYEEGYTDAVEYVIDGMPHSIIDAEELEDSLYWIFDDEDLAQEVRDLIFDNISVYERWDYAIPYSNLGMDYAY